MSYPEFGHIGFKLVCTLFMCNTMSYYSSIIHYKRAKYTNKLE